MPKQKKVLMPRGAIQKKAEWSGTRGSYLTHIPNLSRDTLEEIEVVPIREPFTYSRVVYDHDRSEYVYEVWEPQLNAEEKEFLDMIKDSLNSFAVMLGQRCGKQISVANPILDGTSVEGHRVQATYSKEVTTRGSSFTIRRYKEKPFTPVELVKFGTASAEMVAYLWVAVESGKSMMVCGGAASGKTATLNSAALFIRPGAKIVSIEDTREINLPHENWIPGTTRSGVGERGADGKAGGEIDMYDLVRAALRQRPNYIVVGEVRGKETYTMFQAMATGHPTMTTMHADSVKSMVNRLENPPINTPRILLTALNFVIIQSHARIGDSIVRRMKQIVELVGFEPETNELITNTVYEWDAATDTFVYKGHSFLFDEIMEMKNMTHEEMEAEFQRRVDIVNYMLQKNMIDFREIAKIVVQYYQYPEDTAKRVREEMGWQDHAVMKAVETGGETVGELGVRETRDARHAHEDEAVPPRRGVRQGRPHGEAPEGSQAGQCQPAPEGSGRVAHVREVRPGTDRERPGARGQPPEGPHPAPARRVPGGRLDEHDVRGGGRGRRRVRRGAVPAHPEHPDRHAPLHLRDRRGAPNLLLVHVRVRAPSRLSRQARGHGEEARPQDRQADLRRDVVHLRDELRRRPRGRDLQRALETDHLRRGRQGGGVDYPRHGAARPRHPDRAPEGGAALPVLEVLGLPARRRHDIHERRPAQTILPLEGGAVRERRPPGDAEEDGDARDARGVVRDCRRGVPAFPRCDHGDHGADQQDRVRIRRPPFVRGRRPHDPDEPVRVHLRHLEHGTGGLR